MPGHISLDNGGRTELNQESDLELQLEGRLFPFYIVHIVYRWFAIAYSLVILLLIPMNLQRSRSFLLGMLVVIVLWNLFITPVYMFREIELTKYGWVIVLDTLISLCVVLLGGGWGNILIVYAISSPLAWGLDYGLVKGLISAATLSGAFLASLWIPPGSFGVLETQGKGIGTIASWCLSFFVVALVGVYLRWSEKRMEKDMRQARENTVQMASYLERVSLMAEANSKILSLFKGMAEKLGKLREVLGEDRANARTCLGRIEEVSRGAVEDHRSWMKSLRGKVENSRNIDMGGHAGASGDRLSLLSRDSSKSKRVPGTSYRSIILFAIILYRFISLAVAFLLILWGRPLIKPEFLDYSLVIICLAYNVIFTAALLARRDWMKPGIVVPVDLAITFLLLTASGGWESYFFIYSFSTAGLGALWFGWKGALMVGVGLSVSHAGALWLNGYTQKTLERIGDLRNVADCSFEYMLVSLTAYFVVAMYRQVSETSRTLTTSRVTSARARERAAMARSIHDGAVQTLASLAQRAALLREMLSMPGNREENIISVMNGMEDIVSLEASRIEELSSEFKPPRDKINLISLIKERCNEVMAGAPMQTEVEIDPSLAGFQVSFPEEFGAVVGELFLNVAEHSNAENIHIGAGVVEGKVVVTVQDDGIGFDVEKEISRKGDLGHYGLIGVKERCRQIGAEIVIQSSPGEGTLAIVRLPSVE